MGPRGVRAAGVAALVAIQLAACAGQSADRVALTIYHWNRTDDAFSYGVTGTLPGEPDWTGTVPDVASSSGCGWVGRDWELFVTAGDDLPDPTGGVAARITGAEIGDPDAVTLAITVQVDGSVAITGGVPGWWDSDLQHC